MQTLEISADLSQAILTAAQNNGLSVEDYLNSLIASQTHMAAQPVDDSVSMPEPHLLENLYQTFVEQSPQGMLISQRERIVFANQKIADLLGYTVEELIALDNPFETLIHPNYQQVLREAREQFLAGEAVESYDLQLVTHSGGDCWMRTLNQKINYQGETAIAVTFIDRSEIREAHEAYEQSEARFQRIFAALTNPIIVYDENARFVMLNEVAAGAINTPLDEVIGKTLGDFIPDAHDFTVTRLRAVLDSRTTHYFEDEIQLPSGETRWYWSVMEPIDHIANLTRAILVISYDITERKQAEIELREKERYLSRLNDSLGDAVITVVPPHRTITYVNRIMTQIFGYTPDELIGQSTRMLYSDDASFAEFGTKAKKASDIQLPSTIIEHRFMRKNGEQFWGQVTVSFLYDEAGNQTETISIVRDIDEQKRMYEELQQHRQRLEQSVVERSAMLEATTRELQHEAIARELAQETLLAEMQQTELIIQNVADAIIFTDVSATVLYVNPAWEELNGYSSREIIGRNLRELETEKTPDPVYQDLWETIQSGRVWSGVTSNRRKDGTHYDALVRIAPVKDIQGDISHFVEVCRDITEERQLAAMKEDFIARAAHDLSNPLTVLGTTLHLLRRDPSQLERRLEIFEEQINRLDKLIQDLYILSSPESPKAALSSGSLNLSTLVAKVVNMQTVLASEKGVQLSYQPADESLQTVGEADALERVFVNLISNAINYTDAGGVIYVAEASQDGWNIVTVEDSGVGIPAHDLPHIFDSFYRSEKTRSTHKGSGLGLSIVRQIVELHNGNVEVQSEFGVGTTFRVYLPQNGKSAS